MRSVLAQAIPAHTFGAQLTGAIVFVVLLFAVVALWRHTMKKAELERAEALIEERWAHLNDTDQRCDADER